ENHRLLGRSDAASAPPAPACWHDRRRSVLRRSAHTGARLCGLASTPTPARADRCRAVGPRPRAAAAACSRGGDRRVVRPRTDPGENLMGPGQVLLVGFDQPRFSGEVLAEFARLREAGIVRLLDLLLVERAEDGSFNTLAAPTELGTESGDLAAALLGDAAGT